MTMMKGNAGALVSLDILGPQEISQGGVLLAPQARPGDCLQTSFEEAVDRRYC